MITKRTASALAGLGLVLSLSACSSSGDTADANAAYCEGAAKVQEQVTTLEGLLADGSSPELIKQQWNAVQSAIQANSVPLSQLQKSVQDDLAAANEAFDSAIAAIPEGTPVSEAAPQYKAAIDTWDSSVSAIQGDLGCTP